MVLIEIFDGYVQGLGSCKKMLVIDEKKYLRKGLMVTMKVF